MMRGDLFPSRRLFNMGVIEIHWAIPPLPSPLLQKERSLLVWFKMTRNILKRMKNLFSRILSFEI